MQLGLPFDVQHEPPSRFRERATAPAVPDQQSSRAPELYYVRHRRARRYVLRLDLDGRVRVTIPRGGSRREAAAFAARQAGWIRQRVEEYRRAQQARPALPAEEGRRLRVLARQTLPPRLLELAAQHGLTVTRVSVRDQRSRWGSCGRDGHICLNWRLVQMPGWVRDYVLIHELMHLRRMDHSLKYWRHVAAAYPAYEAAREWLRAHGPGLQ